ncbi:mitochondrial fission process protein 1 [Arctopsyche grandis]|uniref:mitochondrial fission process protein 1 n=1 Tax=Arctopsyche grandis TaxID=121162 RepID=UPI00406D7413
MTDGGDFFRDPPARYLGYANEVGEAFRKIVKDRYVHLSYGVACTYVLADTVDKAIKAKNSTNSNCKMLIAAGDTLLWQMFASVIIPGFTINRLCAGTRYALDKGTKLPGKQLKLVATAVGLLSIPVIIHPIDTAVHKLMDLTYRKYFSI